MSTNQKQQQRSKPKQPQKRANKHVQKRNISKSAHTRKQQKAKQKMERKLNKRPRRRIFPIWLRLIVIALFAVSALAAGLVVGYGVLGDGNPSDALKMETWQHIIDIVKKEK